MKEITLEEEKFETIKVLAEMQEKISLGRAEFKKLKETTEEYLVVREKEAEARVLEVLKKSRDALEATTINHKELSGYNRDLEAYAGELSGLSTEITALFQDFRGRVDESNKEMERFFLEVSEINKGLKLERVIIKGDREQLQRERALARDEFILLADRRKLLEDGFKELKKLKGNKQ